MLSGKDTHHRPVGCFRHPAGCRFNAFPGQFYTMPQRKSSGFPYLRHGIPADPSAPASAPPLRWRRQRIFEAWGPFDYKRVIHGDASHAGVSLALPWGMTAWPTVQQNGAVGDPAYLIYIYITRYDPPQAGRQKWGWDAECPVLIFGIRGHPQTP